jgi:hypothetical protein
VGWAILQRKTNPHLSLNRTVKTDINETVTADKLLKTEKKKLLFLLQQHICVYQFENRADTAHHYKSWQY